jgi:carotenoid cleavage dioxygenase-like enzyme
MKTFDASNPAFAGFNYPQRFESDLVGLEVEGNLPMGLNGTFYRVGGDPHFVPFAPHLLIDGDGMVTALRVANGEASVKSRWVRNQRFELERAAGRALFGSYRNPYSDLPEAKGCDRTLSNTAVLWHGKRFLTLKEDGLPYEMDPITLDTRGRHNFAGKVTSKTMIAHPKVDPETGELIFIGTAAKGETTRDVASYVADSQGRITHEMWFEAPYGGIVHDMAATKNWTVVPMMPATNSLERIKRLEPIYMWEPELATEVAIYARHATSASEIRWFRKPACFFFHVLNAYEEGSLVHMDVMEAEAFPFPFPISGGRAFDPNKAVPRLTRWTFDLKGSSDQFKTQRLSDYYAEMPRGDDRFALRNYRHGFMGVNDPAHPNTHTPPENIFAHNSLGHWDHKKSDMKLWFTGKHSAVQEPVFVPRSASAPEGDGYVLAAVNRYAENRSDFVVLDTADVASGPVATIKVPFRLKNATHGGWIEGKDLQ